MNQESIISKNILDNMSDGVMTVDLSGTVINFNSSASRILNIKSDKIFGKKFAEIFFEKEGNDDFNQIFLDAIYDSSVTHNSIIKFNTGKNIVFLSVNTSFLKEEDKKIGVIAVFSDITEVKKLKDSEITLLEEIKSQNRELQGAYLKIENSNAKLESALKKVQVIRFIATFFIIFLFVGIGIFTWHSGYKKASSNTSSDSNVKKPALEIYKVIPKPASSSIYLTGNLEPLSLINITSPIDGKIKDINFSYGGIVKKGDIILKIDTTEIEIKQREATSAYIKAKLNYDQIKNWEKSLEIARVKRSLAKAKLSLEAQKEAFEKSERLFEKGIISEIDYESAKNQYINQQMDYQSALEEMDSAFEKGNEENKKVARYELENSVLRLKEFETQLSLANVISPVSGIVITPTSSSDTENKDSKRIEKGSSVQNGSILVSIGDLSGFSIKSKVDEIDIMKIKLGQKVNVTGDAFNGIKLDGNVKYISSQASQASVYNQGVSAFELIISVENIDSSIKPKIYVGMSSNLEIMIYDNPNALMIPISAVKQKNGKKFVNRITGKIGQNYNIEETEVEVGYTTLDSVEITKGLKEGIEISIF
ncbi:MAG: HlyD family efflux transporter periplasmic adaptor subunit [Desulfobacterales bacterium]|nr:HlyD family efflux transporter periplasmic adaptor subunit [Desulfobacterales bacterium]